MSGKLIIEVSNITKSFHARKVIDKISFAAKEGDIIGLLGPNGAGKTTTIKMILNLIKNDDGYIIVDGHNVASETKKALSSIGVTLESPSFYEYLTGFENLKLIANLYKDVNISKIVELLDLVKLSGRANDKVKTYSTGMKQRLGIARALINKPKLIILDEPTNGLDPQGMRDIYNLIQKLSIENKITFLISSHLLHDIENICNKIVIINKGKVLLSGETQFVLNSNNYTVEIYTDNISKLIEAIKGLKSVKYIDHIHDIVRVQLINMTTAELTTYLSKNNICVNKIQKNKMSLEDLFLTITRECIENESISKKRAL